MNYDPVFSSLTLPNGQTLKNRLVKAAMDEGMAESLLPSEELIHLYKRWAMGGSGLLISGNVMIDASAMTGPAAVVLEKGSNLELFRRWAKTVHDNGSRLWLQLNHPGRQIYKALGGKALSPSAVALDLGKHSKLFAMPKAMDEVDIQDIIQRFVSSAVMAEQAGFDGVQIHAAHGYLLSQFLSPLTNKRTDQWGGNANKRAALLLTIVRQVRAAVRPEFAVAVKINSADFQRGGFDIHDAISLVRELNPLGIDLIEVSGGSYEAPAMQGRTADGRTLAREAYFLEFAQKIATVSQVPVMSTGGITRLATAQQVLNSGVALAGIGRALAICPDLPLRWRKSPDFVCDTQTINWSNKAIASVATTALMKRYFRLWGSGKQQVGRLHPVASLLIDQWLLRVKTLKYRRLMGY